MAEEKIILPPGFRFSPSDQELINDYLKPKIRGEVLRCNIIKKVELYETNSTPWQLFDVNDEERWTDCPGKPEKYMYVFTSLCKLRSSENGKEGRSRENTRKKAGCGTWKGKIKKSIRDHEGDVIGEKRMLTFEINDVGARFDLSKAAHFRMHEYSLCGVNKDVKSANGDDVVLCKITYISSKEPVFKLVSGRSVGHNQEETSVIKMDSRVDENITGTECLGSENLLVGKFYDYLAATDEFDTEQSNKEENLERSLGNNQEGTTITSVVEMDSGVGENIEGTECLSSENLLLMDNAVGESYDADEFDTEQIKEEENLERSLGGNNKEGTTITSVVEMDSGVGENIEGTECSSSENLFVMDSAVGESYNYDHFDNGFQDFNDFNWDPSFYMNWYKGLLNSDQEEGGVEDVNKLGKRKLEEEYLHESKKRMCL